jgi:hypothetical protein
VTANSRVRCTYPQHLLSQPLLYQLSHRFDLVTNIVEAHVTATSACITLVLQGETEQIQAGVTWMVAQGVQVDTIPVDAAEDPCVS